jgi:hypothetical protein
MSIEILVYIGLGIAMVVIVIVFHGQGRPRDTVDVKAISNVALEGLENHQEMQAWYIHEMVYQFQMGRGLPVVGEVHVWADDGYETQAAAIYLQTNYFKVVWHKGKRP